MLKIIDLHISEKLRASQVDGVILTPRSFEVRQKFWPNLPVTPTIFLLGTGHDPHHKSDTLHKTASPEGVRLVPALLEDI
jgi:hypothetical protein